MLMDEFGVCRIHWATKTFPFGESKNESDKWRMIGIEYVVKCQNWYKIRRKIMEWKIYWVQFILNGDH